MNSSTREKPKKLVSTSRNPPKVAPKISTNIRVDSKKGRRSNKKGKLDNTKSRRPTSQKLTPKRQHGFAWQPVSNRRIGGVAFGGILIVIVLVIRVTLVSVTPSSNYKALAAGEGLTSVPVAPVRGTIYDSSGQTLAISTPRSTVVVDPLEIRNPISESGLLSKILGISAGFIRSRMLAPTQFEYVDRQITNSQAAGINSNAKYLYGVSLVNEPIRVDPNGALAASVLGNVSLYGYGQGGVEEMMNSTLSGEPGTDLLYSPGSGPLPPNGLKVLTPTVNGANIQMTLNSAIQIDTEQSLSAEMVATQARAGVAIMVNTQTGSVLSMANLIAGVGVSPSPTVFTPFADPQTHFAFTQQSPINMATDYVYEPGSVAKIATFAAALKAGVITPGSEILVPDHLRVGGALFTDAEQHPTELLSPKDILAQSSNIGTIMIASHLSPQTITSSFLNFGWGRYSGIGLPGESPGFLDPPNHWSGTAPGSVPIGQDQAVTPLAILDSYSAIANGGLLVTPHLIDRVGSKVAITSQRRVLPSRLAHTMTTLLSGVTGPNATAPDSQLPGFQISGKTGTAQIPFGGGKSGYIPGAFMATFVGFTTNSSIPLAEIVVLTEPNIIYGGLTSAKVFSQTMSYALYHLGAAQIPATTNASVVASTVSMQPTQASSISPNCNYVAHRFGASLVGASCIVRLNRFNLTSVGHS